MKITNRHILIFNIIMVNLSILILFKTSNSDFLFGIDKISWIELVFSKFQHGNVEFSALSASILAAYIFYFVNSFIPNAKKNHENRQRILPYIESVFSDISSIYRILNESSGKYLRTPVKDYSALIDLGQNINIGDTYNGVVFFHPDYPGDISKARCKTIEYAILDNINNCRSSLIKLRSRDLLLDHDLIEILRQVESEIDIAHQILLVINATNGKKSNFSNIIKNLNGLYTSGEKITFYYNKKINFTKKYHNNDIWFNPNGKNYVRTAPLF